MTPQPTKFKGVEFDICERCDTNTKFVSVVREPLDRIAALSEWIESLCLPCKARAASAFRVLLSKPMGTP